MKNRHWIVGILLLTAVLICSTALAADVAIDEINFPDQNFREYISLWIDKSSDGALSEDELADADFIYLEDNLGISSLKGIEHFTSLTKLYCSNNKLTELDLSQNTRLTELMCDSNQLTALDLSQNTDLKILNCNYNQLTALDLSKNTLLTNLDCNNNQLTALDLSKNTLLTELNCNDNQLTVLDVSYNAQLTALACEYNQLTVLDVSKNTELESLQCICNQLTALDVSKNTLLTGLTCSYNSLTSLDVSKNTLLTDLDCEYNQLTALDVSKNTLLTNLDCSDNSLTTLDVTRNTGLTALDCVSNQLTTLDVSRNTGLTYLTCYSNQLTALALPQSTGLTRLACESNQLTALDVSQNTQLTDLTCQFNQLTALDLSNVPKLSLAVTNGSKYEDEESEFTAYSYGDYYLHVDSNVTITAAAETSGETPDAVPLTLGEEATADITGEGEIAYFSFTPTETAQYVFCSLSDDDTYGYLYSTAMIQLEESDDIDDGNMNFRIVYELQADTLYYFGACFSYDETTGSFPVMLEKADEMIEDNHLTVSYDGQPVENYGSIDVTVPLGETVTLTVQAEADNMEGMAYKWNLYDHDAGRDVEVGTGLSLTTPAISGQGFDYEFVAIDRYENDYHIRFFVRVENNLKAEAAGSAEITVAPGSRVTLKVSASCDQGDPEYRWHRISDYGETIGTEDTLILENTASSDGYECVVTDIYGNLKSVTFHVTVDPDMQGTEPVLTIACTSGEKVLSKGDTIAINQIVSVNWTAEGMPDGYVVDSYCEVGYSENMCGGLVCNGRPSLEPLTDGAGSGSFTVTPTLATDLFVSLTACKPDDPDAPTYTASAFFNVVGATVTPVRAQITFDRESAQASGTIGGVTVDRTVTAHYVITGGSGVYESIYAVWENQGNELESVSLASPEGDVTVTMPVGAEGTLFFSIMVNDAEVPLSSWDMKELPVTAFTPHAELKITGPAGVLTAGTQAEAQWKLTGDIPLVSSLRWAIQSTDLSEEEQSVFGASLTADEIAAGEGSITFTVPEAFRACIVFDGTCGTETIPAESETVFSGVPADSRIRLPDGTKSVEDEAFRGAAMCVIELPDSVTRIGENAFSDCGNLRFVYLPDNLNDIAENAFPDDVTVMAIVNEDTPAYEWADEHLRLQKDF